MADWSELPEDLSLLILEKLPVLEFIRFGAVCTSWRSVQKSKKDCASPGLPWMMLCDDDHENQTRGFFSITEGKTHRLVLPDIIGKRCCGSSHGWLVTIDRKADMNLLHPLSRTQIPLPHPPPPYGDKPNDYHCQPGYLQCISIYKAVLSADPYVSPEDCVVMIIYGHIGRLAFCRLGDESWTSVSQDPFGRFFDVCYYQGKFHGVDCFGQTVVCHIDVRNPHVTYLLPRGDPHDTGTRYLAESMGDLLQVVRILGGFTDEEGKFHYTTKGFEVYRLDSERKTWERVESLGDRALFVGYNGGISVSSSASEYYHSMCKENAIYFTDNHYDTDIYRDEGMSPGCEDHGVYSLSDGSFESFFPRSVAHPKLSPPIWCTPSIIHNGDDVPISLWNFKRKRGSHELGIAHP